MIPLLLAALLLAAQDPSALIDKLRSDRASERDQASAALLGLGEASRAALEKVKDDPDREVADRVRELLARLELRKSLTPALLKAFPNLDLRLAGADDRRWTEVLFEAAAQEKSRLKHPELRPADLDLLAPRAWRGAARAEFPRLTEISECWHLPSSLPPLLKLLDDRILDVRRDALRAVIELLRPECGPALLAALRKEEDPWQLEQLMHGAARLHLKEAVPDLRRRLMQEEAPGEIQRAALEALGSLGGDEEVPFLLQAWKSPGVRLDWNVLGIVLSRLNADKAFDLLSDQVRDAAPDARFMPLSLLLHLRTPRVIPEARRGLSSPDNRIRSSAHDAVRRLRAAEAIADLKPLLDNPDEFIRQQTAETLAFLGDASAIPALLKELDGPQVRWQAVNALGSLDCRPVFPALREQLKKGKTQVASILVHQGGEEEVRALLPLATEATGQNRSNFGAILAGAGSRAAVPLLRADLDSPDFNIRNRAADALGRLGLRDTFELFRDHLKSADRSSHYPVIRYMGRIGGRDAVPFLEPLLDDAEIGRRREALVALEEAGAVEFLPRARALMTEHDLGGRIQAAGWLVRSGSPDGVPTLLGALHEQFALNALRRPDLWKKMASIPAPNRGGYRGEYLETEALAAAAGLKLDVGGRENDAWFHRDYGPRSLLKALEMSSAILEEDRLRILPPDEAWRFWSAWWREYSRPK